MAPIQTHEQARKQDYVITWKLSLPLKLLEKPVTVGLPRSQGQMPSLGGSFPNWHLGFRIANEIPSSGTEGPKLASVFQSEGATLHRSGRIPQNRKWQGKERDADVLLDNHLQTWLISMQHFDAVLWEPRCIWDISFPSLLKKFFKRLLKGGKQMSSFNRDLF